MIQDLRTAVFLALVVACVATAGCTKKQGKRRDDSGVTSCNGKYNSRCPDRSPLLGSPRSLWEERTHE